MFIERLNELMSEKNIKNYKQLAQETQIPATTVYNWKTYLPNGENLISLANFFEVSIDYLVGRTDDVGLIQTNANLTEIETDLLTLFRTLTPKDQGRVYGMIRAYAG